MAEQDRHRDDLDEETATFIYQSTREFVEDLSEKGAERNWTATIDSAAKVTSAKTARVICVPANGEADEIAGVMLAQLLGVAGHDVKCISVLAGGRIACRRWRTRKSSIICISAIPPLALTHARAIYERLRAQFPSQSIIVGLWNYSGDAARSASRIDTPERVQVVTTLGGGCAASQKIQMESAARIPEQSPPEVPSVHDSD